MKKILLLLILCVIFCCTSRSQQFSMLGAGLDQEVKCLYFDTASSMLYAGGGFSNSGTIDIKTIGKWNGSNWDTVDNRISHTALSIESYLGDIYCAGSMKFLTDSGYINYNLVMLAIDSPHLVDQGTDEFGRIFRLIVDSNNLYAFGDFDTIGGIPASNAAKFDGSNWSALPTLDDQGYIICAAFYNGELYVGGNFVSPIGPGMKDIAKFDGVQWVSVGGGFSGSMTFILDMEVWNGKLYVGGYFNALSGDPGNNIAAWDGTNWSNPGGGLGTVSASVWSLEEYQGDLWAGGVFGVGSPLAVLARWDGNQWSGSGLNIQGTILSLESGGNELYAAGGPLNVNGTNVNRIFKYISTTSIEEKSKDVFSVFPNPINDGVANITFLNPQSKRGMIEVYDILGKKIYCQDHPHWNSPQQLYLPELNDGVYNMVFTSGSLRSCKRIVILNE